MITDGPFVSPEAVVGLTAQLSVMASDPDGDALSYAWSVMSQPEDSTPQFASINASTSEVRFDRVGSYQFQVTIDDSSHLTHGIVSVIVHQSPDDINQTLKAFHNLIHFVEPIFLFAFGHNS